MTSVIDPAETRPFWSPKQLAERLNLSDRTVRQMIADRRIRAYKVAGRQRIDPADVDVYLRERCNREEVSR